MTTELHRAFTSLGRSPATRDDKQLPPYFLSYSVSDASIVMIRAQYGALVPTAPTTCAWPTSRCASATPKLDNTHGDSSRLGGQQHAAPAQRRPRSARPFALAGHQHRLQQRARQLPARQDRSPGPRQGRRHLARLQPGDAAGRHRASPRPPSQSIAPHGSSASRALSQIFREYPDVYQNIVMLTVQNETDYFASSEGSRVVTPHLQARLVASRRHARRRRHGPVSRADLRSRNRRRPALAGRA